MPLCHALRRARLTPAQVALPGGARRVNLRGAFVLAAAAERIRGRTVVLVDDVLTTGATVTACADALTAAAPRRIVVPYGSPSRERTAALTAARTVVGRLRAVDELPGRRCGLAPVAVADARQQRQVPLEPVARDALALQRGPGGDVEQQREVGCGSSRWTSVSQPTSSPCASP